MYTSNIHAVNDIKIGVNVSVDEFYLVVAITTWVKCLIIVVMGQTWGKNGDLELLVQ